LTWAPFAPILVSVQTTTPMTFSTFPELLSACTDPNNGTIRWSTACQTAKDHGVWEEFCTEYGTKPFRVDTGELLTWLGY